MEFAVTAKIRNKPLYEAVQKLGSQTALAEYLGVSQATIGQWLNLNQTPALSSSREYWENKIGEKLFELTYKTLDEIFPEELRTDKKFLKQKKEFTKFIETDIQSLSDGGFIPKQISAPDKSLEISELKHLITQTLESLTAKQRKVIEMRFALNGEDQNTYEEIGRHFGVTRERIRQVEAKALRRLRHPKRSRSLKSY